MKLNNLLNLISDVANRNYIPQPFICGGAPRDKILGLIKKEIPDIDITCGSAKVHNLSVEVGLELKKHYSIKEKKGDDGHSSIFIGDFKLDFSAGFNTPNIDAHLHHLGIKDPTSMQREMFSRDFTCNALLMDLDLTKITDPTKLGLPDIKKRLLKTCLDPDTTFRYNTNRIIRTVYLSAKLDFDVDPEIIEWISAHKDFVRISSDHYLTTNIDKAMSKNPERAIDLINKTNLWDVIPTTDSLRPYLNKRVAPKTAQLRKNYDLGEGLYENLDRYKSVSDFRRKRRKKRMRLIKRIKDTKLK